MRLARLSAIAFGIGVAAAIGVFFGLHFFVSSVQHGGLF